MRMDGKTRAALAANVRTLMAAVGWSQVELSRRSGVAQRTISNLLRPETGSTTVETVTALAGAFGVEPWALLVPGLPPDVAQSPALRILIDNYLHAGPQGRRALDRIGELEAAHSADDPPLTTTRPR